jgi:hypothetical protein
LVGALVLFIAVPFAPNAFTSSLSMWFKKKNPLSYSSKPTLSFYLTSTVFLQGSIVHVTEQ